MRIGGILGLGVGVLAGIAANLLYARDLEREVDALRREVDDLRGGEQPRPGPKAGERPGPPAEDAYEAQVRAREEGRARPEERGDYEMME